MSGVNPVGNAEKEERELEQTRIIENVAATYRLADNLCFRSVWGFDILNVDEYFYRFEKYDKGCKGTARFSVRSRSSCYVRIADTENIDEN